MKTRIITDRKLPIKVDMSYIELSSKINVRRKYEKDEIYLYADRSNSQRSR